MEGELAGGEERVAPAVETSGGGGVVPPPWGRGGGEEIARVGLLLLARPRCSSFSGCCRCSRRRLGRRRGEVAAEG